MNQPNPSSLFTTLVLFLKIIFKFISFDENMLFEILGLKCVCVCIYIYILTHTFYKTCKYEIPFLLNEILLDVDY